MKEGKLKILAYFDNDSGRDVEMMIPVLYFIRNYLNCKVELAFVFDDHAIYRKKPDLVLLPNVIGSHLYKNVAKYAWEQGIPVFALESEGNFRTDGVFNHWGFNDDKIFFQEYVCCWSERARNYIAEREPDHVDKLVVTGGVGFDKYKLYSFMNRDDFFDKLGGKKFDKVVLYAGWTFGKVKFERGRQDFLRWFGGDESKMPLIEEQRKDIEDILRYAIESNPDVLFVLRRHPKEVFQTESSEGVVNEMSNLQGYSNVAYVGNEFNIHDLISVSDLLLSFESTTSIETWMMGKQSVMIRTIENFSETHKQKKFHLAQPVANTPELLDDYIKEFYKKGEIEAFNDPERQKFRREVVKNSIGFDDGLNHIRTCYYLSKVLDKVREGKFVLKRKFRFRYFMMYLMIKAGLLFYNRRVYSWFKITRKFIFVFEEYSLKNVDRLYQKYSLFLDQAYKKMGLGENLKDGSFMKKLMNKED